jgi:hypothetical protein
MHLIICVSACSLLFAYTQPPYVCASKYMYVKVQVLGSIYVYAWVQPPYVCASKYMYAQVQALASADCKNFTHNVEKMYIYMYVTHIHVSVVDHCA